MCIVCEVKKAGATGAALDVVEAFAKSVADVLNHAKRIDAQDLTQFGAKGRDALQLCETLLTSKEVRQGLTVKLIAFDSDEGKEIAEQLRAAGIEVPQPTNIH